MASQRRAVSDATQKRLGSFFVLSPPWPKPCVAVCIAGWLVAIVLAVAWGVVAGTSATASASKSKTETETLAFAHKKVVLLTPPSQSALPGLAAVTAASASASAPASALKQTSSGTDNMRPTSVPVHVVYGLWDDKPMPRAFQDTIRALETLPGVVVCVWDRAACKALIASADASHFPGLQAAYDSAPRPVQRADIVRYVIVWAYGGWYLDLDVNYTGPPTALASPPLRPGTDMLVLVEHDGVPSRREQETTMRNDVIVPVCVANYGFFAATPHAAFLADCVRLAVARVTAHPTVPREWDIDDYVLYTTGPNVTSVSALAHQDTVTLFGNGHRGDPAWWNHVCTGTWRASVKPPALPH